MTGPGRPDHPVLVVGAGPVGLALVLALRRQGVAAVAYDSGAGPTAYPKARLISARSMELLRRWGVAPAVRAAALPGGWRERVVVARSVTGAEWTRVQIDAAAGVGPEPSAVCPQDRLESVLAAAVPDGVRWNRRVTGLCEDGDLVRVDTAAGSVHAGYVVCADGIRGLGSQRPGAGARRVYGRELSLRVDIDLERATASRPAFIYYLMDRGLSAQMLVVDGRRDWIMSTLVRGDSDLDDAAFRALLARITGLDRDDPIVRAAVLTDVRGYELGLRVAEELQRGRVFRAGDAAHEVLPTGAIGINVGFGDVGALAWRLAAVVDGRAPSDLLADYHRERHPVAVASAAYSRRMLNAVAATLGAVVRSDGSRLAAEAAGLAGYIEHPGLDFPATPWSGVGLDEGLVDDGRPGTRAPHVPLRDGGSTLDYYDDAEPVTLLDGTAADAAAFPAAGRVVGMRDAVDPGVDWAARHGIAAGGWVRVRPDGYVAARSAVPVSADQVG